MDDHIETVSSNVIISEIESEKEEVKSKNM